jgi:hypothetical protein
MKEPAKHPCGSCPYRRDVPSGVWDESEYDKLPEFDKPTAQQPPRVFMCHQGNDRLCAGWVACHDMYESLGFRIAAADLDKTTIDAILDYTTDVPLFASGAEAAAHGLAKLYEPPPKARKIIDKLNRKRSTQETT